MFASKLGNILFSVEKNQALYLDMHDWLLFSAQNKSKGYFFSACKLICDNKAHATVITKFIRRKLNGNGSEIELVWDYMKRKTFLFVDFFNFTLFFFFFFTLQHFFFKRYHIFSFFLCLRFISLLHSVGMQLSRSRPRPCLVTETHVCTHAHALKQTSTSACFVFHINVLSCTSSSAASIVVMLIYHPDCT